jgi:hypothetical protein
MKRLIAILMFFLLQAPFPVQSQPGRDKVEALRVSFISRRLELSVSESEKFWPLYNAYNDRLKAIRRNLRQSYDEKGSRLTEQDAAELHAMELRSRQAEVDLYRDYSEKFRAVIGLQRLAKLHMAEEDFKQEMINTIRGK